jgi:hypothetical protein
MLFFLSYALAVNNNYRTWVKLVAHHMYYNYKLFKNLLIIAVVSVIADVWYTFSVLLWIFSGATSSINYDHTTITLSR